MNRPYSFEKGDLDIKQMFIAFIVKISDEKQIRFAIGTEHNVTTYDIPLIIEYVMDRLISHGWEKDIEKIEIDLHKVKSILWLSYKFSSSFKEISMNDMEKAFGGTISDIATNSDTEHVIVEILLDFSEDMVKFKRLPHEHYSPLGGL